MGVNKDSTRKIRNEGLHQLEPQDSIPMKAETPKRYSTVTCSGGEISVLGTQLAKGRVLRKSLHPLLKIFAAGSTGKSWGVLSANAGLRNPHT